MVSDQPVTENLARTASGTLAAIGWSGENPADGLETAFLLAYSLGDADHVPPADPGRADQAREAAQAATRALLDRAGLHVGGLIEEDGRSLGLRLRIEGGQAVLTMPGVLLRYTAPAKWLRTARERGYVYFLFATRPWPQGIPGNPVSEEELRTFLNGEETLATSAHCVLPLHSTPE